jgi:hypothetical protein
MASITSLLDRQPTQHQPAREILPLRFLDFNKKVPGNYHPTHTDKKAISIVKLDFDIY